MNSIKERWEQLVIFVNEHKPLVLLGSIFLIVLVIILILLSSASSAPPESSTPPPVDPGIDQGGEDTPTDPIEETDEDEGDGDEQEDEDSSSDGPVELNVWGAFITESEFSEIVQEYESQSEDDVTINYTQEISRNSEISGYVNNLNDELSSGLSSAPDIFITKNTWSGQFVEEVSPSSGDQLSYGDFTDTYPSYMVIDFTSNEDVIGVPIWVESQAVVYNVDIWDEAGLSEPATSWTDFISQLSDLPTEVDSEQIAKLNISNSEFNNTEFWFPLFNTLLVQQGLVSTSDGLDLTDQEGVETALATFDDLSSESNWSGDSDLGIAEFLEGRLATYITPSWRLNEIEVLNNAAGLGLNYDIAQLPTYDGNEGVFASYWGFMVNGNSDNVDPAWDFLSYLSQPSTAEELNAILLETDNNEVGLLYPQQNLLADQTQTEFLAAYVNSLQDAKTWGMYSELEVEPLFQQYLQDEITLTEFDESVTEIIQN